MHDSILERQDKMHDMIVELLSREIQRNEDNIFEDLDAYWKSQKKVCKVAIERDLDNFHILDKSMKEDFDINLLYASEGGLYIDVKYYDNYEINMKIAETSGIDYVFSSLKEDPKFRQELLERQKNTL